MMGTLGAGLILMGITLVPVWRSPAPDRSVIPQSVGLEDAWYSVSGRWSDLFYGVPNRKQYAFFSPPLSLPITGPDLPFTGSIEELRDDLLFEVESQKPYRWRMRVYETYTSTGWVNDEALVKTEVEEANLEGYIGELKARTEVQIGVRLRAKANALLSVGEPLGTSIRSDVELSPQPSFKMAVEGDQVSYLPPALRKFRDDLLSLSNDNVLELLQQTQQPRSASRTDDNRSSEPPFGDLHDLGFRVTLPSDDIAGESGERPESVGQPYVEIERMQPGTGPPLALLGKRVLVPPKEYRTVGSVSEANFRMLREAGQDYPAWVTDRYLQLPNDFPEKVRKLARDLADGKANPYDKAEAIRRHLLTLPYSLEVRTPPSGQDWVEFFLFHERRGYCQNYAAAMITMLRSLGIPARLAVGFAPGIWDGDRGVWQVLSRHYHAWPEVYFPRYGWVEFEPTPADVQPSLESLGFEPVGGLARGLPDVEECITEIGLVLCDDPDGPSAELDDLFADSRAAGSDASGEGGSGGGILDTLASAWTLLGLGLVLGLVVPVGAFSYIRHGLNRAGYPAVSFASMCLLGRLAGVRLRPQDTPWEYCARLGHALPGHREEVIHITRGFVSTRFGPNKRPAAEDIEQVRTAWRTVRSPLLRRILLRLLPRRK